MGIFSKIGDVISNGIKKFIKKKDPVKPATILEQMKDLDKQRYGEYVEKLPGITEDRSDLHLMAGAIAGGLSDGFLHINTDGTITRRKFDTPDETVEETSVIDLKILTANRRGKFYRNQLFSAALDSMVANKFTYELIKGSEDRKVTEEQVQEALARRKKAKECREQADSSKRLYEEKTGELKQLIESATQPLSESADPDLSRILAEASQAAQTVLDGLEVLEPEDLTYLSKPEMLLKQIQFWGEEQDKLKAKIGTLTREIQADETRLATLPAGEEKDKLEEQIKQKKKDLQSNETELQQTIEETKRLEKVQAGVKAKEKLASLKIEEPSDETKKEETDKAQQILAGVQNGVTSAFDLKSQVDTTEIEAVEAERVAAEAERKITPEPISAVEELKKMLLDSGMPQEEVDKIDFSAAIAKGIVIQPKQLSDKKTGIPFEELRTKTEAVSDAIFDAEVNQIIAEAKTHFSLTENVANFQQTVLAALGNSGIDGADDAERTKKAMELLREYKPNADGHSYAADVAGTDSVVVALYEMEEQGVISGLTVEERKLLVKLQKGETLTSKQEDTLYGKLATLRKSCPEEHREMFDEMVGVRVEPTTSRTAKKPYKTTPLKNEKGKARKGKLEGILAPLNEALRNKENRKKIYAKKGKLSDDLKLYEEHIAAPIAEAAGRRDDRQQAINRSIEARKAKAAKELTTGVKTLNDQKSMAELAATRMVVMDGGNYAADPVGFMEQVRKKTAALTQVMDLKGSVADDESAAIYKLAVQQTIVDLEQSVLNDLQNFYQGRRLVNLDRTRGEEVLIGEYASEIDELSTLTTEIAKSEGGIYDVLNGRKFEECSPEDQAVIKEHQDNIEKLKQQQLDIYDFVALKEESLQIHHFVQNLKIQEFTKITEDEEQQLSDLNKQIKAEGKAYTKNQTINLTVKLENAEKVEDLEISNEFVQEKLMLRIKAELTAKHGPSSNDPKTEEEIASMAQAQTQAFIDKHKKETPEKLLDSVITELVTRSKDPKTARAELDAAIADRQKQIKADREKRPYEYSTTPDDIKNDPELSKLKAKYGSVIIYDENNQPHEYILNAAGRKASQAEHKRVQELLEKEQKPERLAERRAAIKADRIKGRIADAKDDFLSGTQTIKAAESLIAQYEERLAEAKTKKEKNRYKKLISDLKEDVKTSRSKISKSLEVAGRYGYKPVYATKLDKDGKPVLDKNGKPVEDRTQLLGFVDPKNSKEMEGYVPVKGFMGKTIGYRKPAPEVVEQPKPNVEESKITEIKLDESEETFKFEHSVGKPLSDIEIKMLKEAKAKNMLVYKTETRKVEGSDKEEVVATDVATGFAINEEALEDLYPVYAGEGAERHIVGYTTEATEQSKETVKQIRKREATADTTADNPDATEEVEVTEIELADGSKFGFAHKKGESVDTEKVKQAMQNKQVVYKTTTTTKTVGGKEVTETTVDTNVVVGVTPEKTDDLYPVYNDKHEVIGYTTEATETSKKSMAVIKAEAEEKEAREKLEQMRRASGDGAPSDAEKDEQERIAREKEEARKAAELKQKQLEEQRLAATRGSAKPKHGDGEEEVVDNNSSNGDSAVVTEEQQPQRQNADSQPLSEEDQLYEQIFYHEDQIRKLESKANPEERIITAKQYYQKILSDPATSEESKKEAQSILTALGQEHPDAEAQKIIDRGIQTAVDTTTGIVQEKQRILYHKGVKSKDYGKGIIAAAERQVSVNGVTAESMTEKSKRNLEDMSRRTYGVVVRAEQERERLSAEQSSIYSEFEGLELPKVTKVGAEIAASYWGKEISKLEQSLSDIKLKSALIEAENKKLQIKSNKRIVCSAIADTLTQEQNKLPEDVKKKLAEDAAKAEPILSEGIEGKTVKINGKDVPLMDGNGVINTQAVDQYLQEHGVDALVMTEVVRKSVGAAGSTKQETGLEDLQARTESFEQTDEGLVPVVEDEKTGKRRAVTLRDYVLHTRAQGLFDQQTLEHEAETIEEEPTEEQKIAKATGDVAERTKGMVDTAAQQRKPAEQNTGARQQK